MPIDFAKYFLQCGGQPIQWEGRTLHSHVSLDVRRGDRIDVSFLRFVESPVQGLSISSRSRHLEMECAGTVGRSFVLWTDTAPKQVSVEIRKPVRAPATLTIRNVWRDEKYGTTMAGLNAAAIQLHVQAPNELLMRCSDGWLGPDFGDLVVLARLVHGSAVAGTP